jgi:hypothetical protein
MALREEQLTRVMSFEKATEYVQKWVKLHLS